MKRRAQQLRTAIFGLHVVAATIYYLLGIYHQLADLARLWQ